MKISILLLIALICLTTTSARLSCKNKRSTVCRKVRRKPYFVNVKVTKRVPYQQKYIRKTRVPYRKRVCQTKYIREKYKQPYRARLKIRVRKTRARTTYYYINRYYKKKITRRKRYTVKRRYKVKYRKRIVLKTRVKKYRKVSATRRSICLKSARRRKYRRVRKIYRSTCIRYRSALKKIYVYKYILKVRMVKKWTGRYQRTNNLSCYKRVYRLLPESRRVRVRVAKLVTYRKRVRVRCQKSRWVRVGYWQKYVRKYSCRKRYTKYVPYYVTVRRVIYRTFYKWRVKTYYRWRNYAVWVRATKRVRRKRVTIVGYWGYKYVWGYKYRIRYRRVSRVSFRYVTVYRWKYTVRTRTRYRNRVTLRRKPYYAYNRKCRSVVKRVCKRL